MRPVPLLDVRPGFGHYIDLPHASPIIQRVPDCAAECSNQFCIGAMRPPFSTFNPPPAHKSLPPVCPEWAFARYSPSTPRAITMRRISLVPSPIDISRVSRYMRSTSNSRL